MAAAACQRFKPSGEARRQHCEISTNGDQSCVHASNDSQSCLVKGGAMDFQKLLMFSDLGCRDPQPEQLLQAANFSF
eukprot:scaffold7624_cov248-Pinguiococcus_pyrenoidosus.AAC.16